MARSSWTGTISCGPMVIPVTLGKAAREEREGSIVQLCACHHLPIDRKERCEDTGEFGPRKVRGVKMPDGSYRAVAEAEWASVEEETKDDALEVLSVEPLSQLPMMFSTGTYFVRAKKDDRASAKALAKFTAALGSMNSGCVVKLCSSAKQELAVLSAYQGYMLLTLIPFYEAFSRPGDAERAHMSANVSERDVTSVATMLREYANDEGFQWKSYENTGLKLRQQLADRYLADEPTQDEEFDDEPIVVPDVMAGLIRQAQAAAMQKAVA